MSANSFDQQEKKICPHIFDTIPIKKTEPVNTIETVEKRRALVLHKMYVSNVGNRLRDMNDPMDVDCQRWPWELMQNAKDSIAIPDSIIKKDTVDIQLFLKDDVVIFMHNGLPFNGEAYLALLYKYSDGKANNAESTGRFGTGFLTTHSLSKVVHVEGDIFDLHEDLSDFTGTIFDLKDNIAGFEVTMYRDGSTPEQLIQGLIRMEEEKKFYIGEPSGWTKYEYILKTKRNHESSELGFDNFKVNIAQTMLFNSKFGIVQFNYKNLYTTTIQHLNTEKFDDISIVTFQLQNEKITRRSFILCNILEHSEELSLRFEQDRNLRLSGCIEINENKELIYDTKSPNLFCSLPLVGSESHEMPITLNSDDFEPNTERQGILLNGAEKKPDEECLSDVGINRFILQKSISIFESIVKHCSEQQYHCLYKFTRGLKNIPNVQRDFDPTWYKMNVMLPYRSVLMKYPIVFTEEGIKKIDEVFIPIYPSGKDNEYKKQFHHFTKLFFGLVPSFEESIEWSNRIWKEELTNLVNIERLLRIFKEKECDDETKNSFIKFAWDNHKELLSSIPILINQNNEYITYTDEFADGSNVKEDAVDLMEELKIQWRKNHLNRKITSIILPLVHDHQFAMSTIKNNNNPDKKFIFTRYIIENDQKREKMFMFAKEFFPNNFEKDGKVVECYNSYSIDQDLWDSTDNQLFRDMMKIIEENGKISNVQIPNLVEFIDFVRNYYPDPNIFDSKALIPAKSGNFHTLNHLFEEEGIPQILLDEAKKYLDYDISDEIKDPSFSCVKAPKEFNLINFMTIVNKKLSDDGIISDTNKFQMSLVIVAFLPEDDEKVQNYQKHLQEAVKTLGFQILPNQTIDQTKVFWEEANTILIHEIEQIISNCGNIKEFKSKFNLDLDQYLNQFIDLLHPDKYELIPNQNGVLCLRSDLSNDINIPESVKDVFKVLENDLEPKLKMNSVNIECPNNESIESIIGKLNESLKKADEDTQQQASSMIIDMLPSDQAMAEQQTNIQTLYHNLTKTIPKTVQIECSNEAFWSPANKIIIKFCQHLITKAGDLKKLTSMTGISDIQYIELLNIFSSFLNIDEVAIIPNYYGIFKKRPDLYLLNQPEGIFVAIKDHIGKDLFESFIDKRVKIDVQEYSIFNAAKIMNDNFSRISDKKKLLISKEIIKHIPKSGQLTEKLTNLLNIVNTFDTKNIEPIEVEQCESLYSNVLPVICRYINQMIERCCSLDKLANYFPNPIEFLNKNEEILIKNQCQIVPDQEGRFHYLSELKQDDGIYDELKQILMKNVNLYKQLIHKEITAFHSSQTMTNDSVITYINKYAAYIAVDMLHIIPENENENQIKLLHLYQKFFNIEKESKTLNLLSHFWQKTNNVIVTKIITEIQQKSSLSDISTDEDEAINLLKILYEFANPSTNTLRRIKMVPNQLGKFLSYDDLYNEQEQIPNEFKNMLEQHFSFDIRKMLQDSRLSIKVDKSLSIDSPKVIDIINKAFNQIVVSNSGGLKFTKKVDQTERSKAFIIFQPNGEDTSVHKFIQCYKFLFNLDFEPITLSTSNTTLWNVPIETLTKLIIKTLSEDKTIQNCSKRISKNENEVIEYINLFSEFTKDASIFPNMLGTFCSPLKVFSPDEIDNSILNIYASLNPEDDFRKQLIHPGITRAFPSKTLKEIADKIDREIKKILSDEKRINDENVREGCKSLIMGWLRKNQDKAKLFPYIEQKKMDIILNIILDKEQRIIWKETLSNNPEKIFELMMETNFIEKKEDKENDIFLSAIQELPPNQAQGLKQAISSNQNFVQLMSTFGSLDQRNLQFLQENMGNIQHLVNNLRWMQEEERQREENHRRQIEENERRRQENLRRQIEENERRRRARQRRPNNNIHDFIRIAQPVYITPYIDRVSNQIQNILHKIFKKVNMNENNKNAYYCNFDESDEQEDYLIVTYFSDEKKNISLSNVELEFANDFPLLFVTIIVPHENEYHEDNFINEIKIIQNIGKDLEKYNIVDTYGELLSIDDDDFSFQSKDYYRITVKEMYCKIF